jgi:hypothetical protein
MQSPHQRARNQLRLIITAFALAVRMLPVRMQRNLHHHVRTEFLGFVRDHFGEAGREPIAQADDFFIFQQQDYLAERVIEHPSICALPLPAISVRHRKASSLRTA